MLLRLPTLLLKKSMTLPPSVSLSHFLFTRLSAYSPPLLLISYPAIHPSLLFSDLVRRRRRRRRPSVARAVNRPACRHLPSSPTVDDSFRLRHFQ